eukprot:jgi/Hompol1/4058/HPOL_003453-RA
MPHAFLKEIGWCFRLPNFGFHVLFNDGARMLVHPGGTLLEYSASTDEPLIGFSISPSLSQEIKLRLANFAKLVKTIQLKQTMNKR